PVEVYNTGLEMYTKDPLAIVTNAAPPFVLQPVLCNAIFNDLATNALGTNALLRQGSLVTFTNVYFFGKKFPTNAPPATFNSNSYTSFYFDIGGTNVSGANTLNCYQFGYNHGTFGTANFSYSEFISQPVPTNCYQLTGVYLTYNSSPEILPCRLADYVTNPPAIAPRLLRSKNVSTLKLDAKPGSTYTIHTATNLAGPWTTKSWGQGYYPTNVSFVETNTAKAAYYRVTSP
ncbi:MAG TPA: hypothetical protein VF988_13445, partial [Verrucomicrobiae bacterium]